MSLSESTNSADLSIEDLSDRSTDSIPADDNREADSIPADVVSALETTTSTEQVVEEKTPAKEKKPKKPMSEHRLQVLKNARDKKSALSKEKQRLKDINHGAECVKLYLQTIAELDNSDSDVSETMKVSRRKTTAPDPVDTPAPAREPEVVDEPTPTRHVYHNTPPAFNWGSILQ
jgi:hypothetical protein